MKIIVINENTLCNYIYSPSGQLVDIATVRNDSDVGERKGEQTFYQQ
jgi:hypothetical protein